MESLCPNVAIQNGWRTTMCRCNDTWTVRGENGWKNLMDNFFLILQKDFSLPPPFFLFLISPSWPARIHYCLHRPPPYSPHSPSSCGRAFLLNTHVRPDFVMSFRFLHSFASGFHFFFCRRLLGITGGRKLRHSLGKARLEGSRNDQDTWIKLDLEASKMTVYGGTCAQIRCHKGFLDLLLLSTTISRPWVTIDGDIPRTTITGLLFLVFVFCRFRVVL